jgi:hypothetical protein
MSFLIFRLNRIDQNETITRTLLSHEETKKFNKGVELKNLNFRPGKKKCAYNICTNSFTTLWNLNIQNVSCGKCEAEMLWGEHT